MRVVARPLHTLAVLAIVLQILAIYSLNVAHKTGMTWHGGTAVHYVLWQNRMSTTLACPASSLET